MGDVPAPDVVFAQDIIDAFFGVRSASGDPLPLPDGYYYPSTDQYDVFGLLDYLITFYPQDGANIVGLTGEDITHEDVNFVLGSSYISEGCAVISTARYGLGDVSYERQQLRYGKIITHELGHAYGLRHCRNPQCNMSYANSLVELDEKSFMFCETCEAYLTVITGTNAETRRERVAAVLDTYGLMDELGPDGLTPPPAPENLEWYELEH
ncbi:MAG: hypothetical protein JSW52_07195 [Candidatus Coatesbacteria bacterium]|nr:MAG: hypothetical protein JSW52_07195 [Candidatus Coatesbacteria bacterium]